MLSRQEVIEIRDSVREMRNHGATYEEIAGIMEFSCGTAEAIAYSLDLIAYDDSADIDAAIENLVSLNPKPLQDYLTGKQSAIGSLIGLIKKQNAALDSRRVKDRLIEKLKV